VELILAKLHLLYYGKQTLSFFWTKVVMAVVIASIIPNQSALLGLMLLVIVDFITGVWVAAKSRTLSSLGMRRGISKVALYVVFICCISIAEHTVFHTTMATLGAIGLLAATEILSITENLVMLGLPVPYAAQVLKLVSTKAQALGINVAADPGAAAAVKDMVDLLEETVPTIKDETLKTCLDEYLRHWYLFMRTLSEGSLMGAPELATERIFQQITTVLREAKLDMSRQGVPEQVQDIFLNSWCRDILARLVQQTRDACGSPDASPTQKIDRIRDQIVLMSLRLAKDVQKLDLAGANALTQNPQHIVDAPAP
jgi:toxin secretion/phage lysis holin